MKLYQKFLFVVACLITQAATGQTPQYNLILKNDSLVSSTILDFDIYIERSTATAFELASLQPVMTFNTGISSGTLTFTINAGTSELDAVQRPTNARLSISGNELRIAPNPPPGAGDGTDIPLSPGLRVGRFRLTSTTPFADQTPNIDWKDSDADPVTKVNAYVGLVNTPITDTSGHLNQLDNTSLSLLMITNGSPLPSGTAGVAYNNPMNATGGTPPYTWSISAGSLPTGLTLSSGGVLEGTTNVAGTYNFTVRVADNGVQIATKPFSLTIAPATQTQLAFIQQPTNAAAGSTITPSVTVQLRDAFGNNVAAAGISVGIAISSGTGTLSGTVSRTTGGTGLATFNDLSINLAGSKQLAANSAGLSSATSNAFTISASTANRLVFVVEPSNATAATAITPTITVQTQDQFGNNSPSNNVPVQMTLSSGTGVLSGTTVRNTNAAGLASFDNLSIDLAGVKTLTAASSGLTSAVSGSFTISAGDPTQLVFVQHPSNTTAGTAISPAVTVQLRDAFGNNSPIEDVPVTVSLSSGSGPLNGTLTQPTNSTGLATFNNLSLNLTGSKNIAANSSGLSGATSNAFTINAAAPTRIEFVQQPSDGFAGGVISPPVTIRLKDTFNNDVSQSGTAIQVALISGTGTLSGTLSRSTNPSGIATFDNLSINQPGNKILGGTSTGLTGALSDTFTLGTHTITAGAGANGSISPSGVIAVNEGASQSFTITPNIGYQVSDVLVDGLSVGAVSEYTFTNITASHTIGASFAPNTLSITVQTSPPGRAIIVDGVTYTSPQVFSWTANTSHTISTDSIQNGSPGTRYAWTSWNDAGARTHTVTPLVNTTYTANFKTQFFLTMASGAGGSVAPASNWHDSSASVIISATANNGFSFTTWTGTGTGSYSGTANPRLITMGGPISETGNFSIDNMLVTIQTNPVGRSYRVNGVTYTTTNTFSFPPGSSQSLSLDSIQNQTATSRAVWTSWSDGGARTHTFVVPNSDTTVIASFKTQFFLTMNAGSGGSVLPASNWNDSGAVVGITATPSVGYSFAGWTGSGSGSYTGLSNPSNVTMNGAITETGSFALFPIDVVVKSNPRGRTFTIDGVTYTDSVSLVWSATQSHSLSTVSPQYLPDSTSRFLYSSWSDGGAQTHTVAPITDTTFTVNFSTQHRLTMTAGTGGTVSPVSGNYYPAAQVVAITATPSVGYSFGGWTGTGTGSFTGVTNPSSVTMNGPITEAAAFTLNTIAVTIQSSPPGRSIIVDDSTYVSPQTFNWFVGSSHSIDTDSIQNGVANTRYVWTSWSDAGNKRHTVAPVTNTTYTVSFKTQFFLTMTAGTGGTVAPPSSWVDSNAVVGLTATPSTGYSFNGWIGSGAGSFTGITNPVNITVRNPITETGMFSLNSLSVTVTTAPVGRTIIVDGVTYTSPRTFTWIATTSHTISTDSIQPGNATTRYRWTAWSDTGSRSHTVTPLVNTTYTANFATQYFVTMNANTGGTVNPASNWFDSGDNITITGIPNNGYSFSTWTGSGPGSYSGPQNPRDVTISGAITETANFSQDPVLVTLTTNPPGKLFRVNGFVHTSSFTFSFNPGESHVISTDSIQNQTASSRSAFSNWTDGGARVHTLLFPGKDTTIVANFRTQFFLTTRAGNGGTVGPPSDWFDSAATVPIIGIPNTGYTFSGWVGTGNGSYTGPNNPSAVTMGGPIRDSATFTLFPINVVVKSNPRGRTFTIDGVTYTDSVSLVWSATQSHSLSTVSPQYLPDSTSRFFYSSWSDGGAQTHTVAPVTDTTFTVNFSTQHRLTMTAGTGGTVSPVSGNYYPAAQVVAITATPSVGYSFAGWTGTGTGSFTGVTNPSSVTMNGPITEAAAFTLNTIAVTIQSSPPGRSIIVDDSTYISPQTFNWLAGSSHTVNTDSVQDGTAGTRYVWTSWNDAGSRQHTIAPLVPSTFTAAFKTQFFLTMTASTGGTATPASSWYDSSQTVTITATPGSGYSFNGWAGSGIVSYTGAGNPASVTMRSPISETANFSANPVTVTVTTTPTGRTIIVDGVTYVSPRTFNWFAGQPHTIDVDSLQSIGAGTRSRWTAWSDDGDKSHTIAPLTNATYTATFTTQFLLTMNANPGGSVTPSTGWYNGGNVVTITAIPEPGFSFSSWSGIGSGSYTGFANPSFAVMNGPVTQTANFEQNPYSVVVRTNPPGRTYRVNGSNYTTPQTFSVDPGNSIAVGIPINPQSGGAGTQYVWTSWSDSGAITHSHTPQSDTTLIANFKTQYYLTTGAGTGGTVSPPSAWFDSAQSVSISATPNAGFSFSGWTGTGNGSYTGPDNPSSVSMRGPITENAAFTLFPTQVTIRSNPPGRTVIVDGTTFTTPETFTWQSGSSHSIGADSIQVASSDTRYRWMNWSDGGGRSHSVIPVRDTTFVVTFNAQFQLSMTDVIGGTVAPPTAWYDSAQTVNISATPTAGYSFGSWSGTGNGSYTGTANPANVTMHGPIVETASFTINSVQVTVQTVPPGRQIRVDDSVYISPHVFTWTAGTSHSVSTDSLQSGGPGTRYKWETWSDGGPRTHNITPVSNSTVTAVFEHQYFLTMSANPGGTVAPQSSWYDSGSVVGITGYPNAGYSFSTWGGSGVGSYSGFANPAQVRMNGPITEIGNFTQNPVLVTIQTNPPGRVFRLNNSPYTTIYTFSLQPGSVHVVNVDSLQTVAGGIRYAYTSWSDSGARTHSISIPSKDTTFTVNFVTQYALVTSANPGTGGILEPAGVTYFNAGDTARITATPNRHFLFTNWAGDLTGSTNPASLVMSATKAVAANFSAAVEVTLTSTPSGRTVHADDSSYITPKTLVWLKGSSHTIGTISPQPGSLGTQYIWRHWSDSGNTTHVVAPTTDTTFSATFKTQYYLFMVGSSGGQTSPPEGWYDSGSVAMLTATPDTGNGFIEWVGNGPGSYSGSQNPIALTMNAWAAEQATFGPLLAPPSLSGIDDGAKDQSTSPLLSWIGYPGATSYYVQVTRNDPSFTGNFVVDVSGVPGTSLQVNGLENSMTYYWRVKARVGSSITSFSLPRRFITRPKSVSVSSPVRTWITGYPVTIQWATIDVSGLVNVKLSTDGGSSYTTILTDVPNNGSARWRIPFFQTASSLCRVRVEWTADASVYGESGLFAIVSGQLPSVVPLSTSIPYPEDPVSSTFYRLVSMPGIVDSTRPLSNILVGTPQTDWRLFWDNGTSENYLVEYSGSSTMNTGRGYWLLRKNNFEVSTNMLMPPLDTGDASFRIPLHAGWNIIASPFDKPVSWASILELNGLSPATQLYGYEGSYTSAGFMNPFRGYYYFNSANQSGLKIPYPFAGGARPSTVPDVDWTVQIALNTDINDDPENYIGIAPGAAMEQDEMDSRKPPLFLDQGFLYFSRPLWDNKFSRFGADFRPAIGDGQVWDFDVHNPVGQSGTVSFRGIEKIPAEYGVVLINMYNNIPYDLRKEPAYRFATVSPTMPFKLLVGPKAFIDGEVSRLLPKEFALDQNFPNPFNATTSISVRLPNESRIKLEVYSILGQHVRTIADGVYSSGVHTFLWEGNDQAGAAVGSGVYFYRLMEGGTLLQSKKMILAK